MRLSFLKYDWTLSENGVVANYEESDAAMQVQILLLFLGCSGTSRMLWRRFKSYARRCPGGAPIHRYFTALRPPPPQKEFRSVPKEASGVPRFYRQKKAQWYRTYVCICTLSLYAEMRTSHDSASSCDKVSFVDVFSRWFMSRQYKQNERSMTRTEWYHVRSIPLKIGPRRLSSSLFRFYSRKNHVWHLQEPVVAKWKYYHMLT